MIFFIRFVRSQFEDCLPSERTIRKWLESLDGNPGFSVEVLEHLRVINLKEQIYASLSLDEMSIKSDYCFDGKRFKGNVDFGVDRNENNTSCSKIELAHQVLVFFLVALNCHWKIAIGYMFIAALPAAERHKLVEKCISKLKETGVIITNITFDAPSVNISLLQKLGACILPTCMQPRTNITSLNPIFVLLDNAHMLKESHQEIQWCIDSQ